MPDYLVRWEIDITADNPREAASKALEIQRDRDSVATAFQVIDRDSDEDVTIDLEYPEDLDDSA